MSALETSKLVWDWLSKVNEGVSTQRDQRISVLRNLFNRFKRNDNENVQLICDVGEAIKSELDIFIVVSLEAVEEVAKNTDTLVSLCRDAFVDLG